MNCEMCGKKEAPYKAIIEGTMLTVCKNCAKHGKILQAPKQQKPKPKQKETKEKPEITEKVIADYGQKIRQARTKKEMTQEEFAQKINIKESLLNKIENSAFKLSIPLARKLEKTLKIRLVEETEETKGEEIKKQKSQGMTIGDLIKLK